MKKLLNKSSAFAVTLPRHLYTPGACFTEPSQNLQRIFVATLIYSIVCVTNVKIAHVQFVRSGPREAKFIILKICNKNCKLRVIVHVFIKEKVSVRKFWLHASKYFEVNNQTCKLTIFPYSPQNPQIQSENNASNKGKTAGDAKLAPTRG